MKKHKFKTSSIIIITLIILIIIAIFIPNQNKSNNADTDKSSSSSVDWADDDDTSDDDSDNYDDDSTDDYYSFSSEASSSSSSESTQTAPQIPDVTSTMFVLNLNDDFGAMSSYDIYTALDDSINLDSLNSFINTELAATKATATKEQQKGNTIIEEPWTLYATYVGYKSHDTPIIVELSDDWISSKVTYSSDDIMYWLSKTMSKWYAQNNTVNAESLSPYPNINVYSHNTKIYEMGPDNIPGEIHLNETAAGEELLKK